MKRHSMFAATAFALVIATPALANGGLLGGVTGSVMGGAGVLGTMGGTLTNPVSNFGAAGVLGGATQFQGVIMQPSLMIQRPVLPAVTPNLGVGAGTALDAAGQIQGEVVKPGVTILGQPVRSAGQAVSNVNAGAAGGIGGAVASPNRTVQGGGGAFAGAGASAGPAAFGAETSAQAGIRAGY